MLDKNELLEFVNAIEELSNRDDGSNPIEQLEKQTNDVKDDDNMVH